MKYKKHLANRSSLTLCSLERLTDIILLLLLMPSVSWADSTIFNLEENTIGIKAIAWDHRTGAAKVTDQLNNSHEGIVTLSRKHSSDGNKTNIYFKYDKTYYGADAAEFVIFPVDENSFRIIGVSYILKGQEKFLSTSKGNFPATCLSM